MVKLPPADAALEDILELPRVVPRGGLVGDVKVGVDDIADIPQQQRRPLLDLLRGGQVQLPPAPFHHRPGGPGADGGLHLVAPQVHGANGGADLDAVDDIPQSWMPIDRLQQPPGRRGGHHVVAYPLHLHLGP